MEQIQKQVEEAEGDDIADDGELDDDVLNFLEPDPLKQALDQSKEAVDGKVGAIESEITLGLNTDKDKVLAQVEESKHLRNRNIIKEIVTMGQNLRN